MGKMQCLHFEKRIIEDDTIELRCGLVDAAKSIRRMEACMFDTIIPDLEDLDSDRVIL